MPVYIRKPSKAGSPSDYDLVVNGEKQQIVPKALLDDVLIMDAHPANVEELLQVMTRKKLKGVDSITFASEEKEALMSFIKNRFKVVDAAGGVVEKDQRNLLIFRQGKWDLPKGKLDKGEKKRVCAVREVQEETGVEVEIRQKIGHTWHTYVRNGKYVLKRTHWYVMDCVNDTHMQPQVDEDIEQVKWMTLAEIRAALHNSYRSIRSVMQDYHKLLREMDVSQKRSD